MTREWQPGDVAIVRNRWGVWNVAICSLREGINGFVWKYGVADDYERVDDPDRIARPLVVIDPEDAEQVERFVRTWASKFMWLQRVAPSDVECAQETFREFADPKPPKPDEPTGLGAVVRDADGDLWVRRSDVHFICPKNPNEALTWAEVNAAEILSEGWSE